jgi:hypothetical protein
MTQTTHVLPMFYYVIEVGDREFPLVIMPDGMSQWDDHTGRRRVRHPQDQYLELRAFTGEPRALNQLENELLEFTISVPMPEKILAKAMIMAEKEREGEATADEFHGVTEQASKDVNEMDWLLTNFFWKEINPLLSQPINPALH